jgi:diguanylate cyclase (GGDEF)-like protein
MIDLDHFKDVNDTLGHQVGDALLKAVAERLQATLCETDVLARLGGDEFAILQSAPANHHAAAVDLANRILESVAKPFDVEGAMLIVGASIGIAQAPGDGTELNDLMKKADLALYRQKSDGRDGYRFFDDQMMADFDARHRLGNELRNAIHNNELDLHYQQIVDATTRRPCAAEALIRWNRPGRGNVTPDEFIPLAEENGLIVPIGEWVLLRACQDAMNWPEHIKVAVNLSPVQFKKANLFDVILFALVESGLPPERLELELTESILIENHTEILPTIRQLKQIGVSIVLDDFGTGYSSLRYLTMFPFNKIKIDQSFTRDMTKRAECAAVISSVLTIGRILDISITAEGVETEQQFTVLRAAGVNTVQGYLFGRPCPRSQLDFGNSARDQLAEAVA